MVNIKKEFSDEKGSFTRGQTAFGPLVYGLIWVAIGYSVKVQNMWLLFLVLLASYFYFTKLDRPFKYLVSVMDEKHRLLFYMFELSLFVLFTAISFFSGTAFSEFILNLMIPAAAIINVLIVSKVYSETSLEEHGWVKK